jgi:predicted TIM-barrel fold metal-dependent hydrolase
VTALREIIRDRPAADQHKLLYKNAVPIYRLESLLAAE